MNTLMLPLGIVLAKEKGDMKSWGLNLATFPREILYQLQDGVTAELHAREGHTLQILMEHKENMEQVNLQRDDFVTHNQEVEQAAVEACSKVL